MIASTASIDPGFNFDITLDGVEDVLSAKSDHRPMSMIGTPNAFVIFKPISRPPVI